MKQTMKSAKGRRISFKSVPELAPWEVEEIMKQQEQIKQMHEEEGADQYEY